MTRLFDSLKLIAMAVSTAVRIAPMFVVMAAALAIVVLLARSGKRIAGWA